MSITVLATRGGVCTGDGPCDSSHLGAGKNWVTKTDPADGLGDYVHAIAHALQRERGLSESASIATAISAIKHWAAGGGNVTAATRARAAKAVAHWEALKAAAHGSGDRAYITVDQAKQAARTAAHDEECDCHEDPCSCEEGTRSVARDNAAYHQGISDKLAGKPKLTQAKFSATHPSADGDDYPLYEAGYEADREDLRLVPDTRSWAAYNATRVAQGRQYAAKAAKYVAAAKLAKKNALIAAYLRAAAAAHTKAAAAAKAAHNATAAETSKLAAEGARTAARKVSGVSLDEAERLADAAIASHLQHGAVSGMRTGVSEWGTAGPPNLDPTGSGSLLPVGPPRKVADRVVTVIGNHRFVGSDLAHCDNCGRPISALIHRVKKRDTEGDVSGAENSGVRHQGPGHSHVSTGHIRGHNQRRTQAATSDFNRSADSIEQPLTEALQGFFQEQRASTIARLTGKRGRQMFRKAGVRADLPSGTVPEGTPPRIPAGIGQVQPSRLGAAGSGISAMSLGAGQVTAATLAAALGVGEAVLAKALGYATLAALVAALVGGRVTVADLTAAYPDAQPQSIDPSAIFDKGFWDQKLTSVLKPYYSSAAAQSTSSVDRQLELPASFSHGGSLATARQALEDRGNMTSPEINATTYSAIVKQLQAAVEAGEGIESMKERVNAVFEHADRTRARTIAQTETMSALNSSADAYAEALGPDHVASKRWVAHHDDRTRKHHRLADGQTVSLGSRYYVGGYPMRFPGDPEAPPDETINCRCHQVFLPPGADSNALTLAAKNLHQQMVDAAGITLSPAASEYLAG